MRPTGRLSFADFHQRHFQRFRPSFAQFLNPSAPSNPATYSQQLNYQQSQPFWNPQWNYPQWNQPQWNHNWTDPTDAEYGQHGEENSEPNRSEEFPENVEGIEEEGEGEEEGEEGETRLVLSDAAIEFFVNSEIRRHQRKQDQKKKEQQEEDEERKRKQREEISKADQREKSVKSLYGDQVSKIITLEASLNHRYEVSCNEFNPVMWPFLALQC